MITRREIEQALRNEKITAETIEQVLNMLTTLTHWVSYLVFLYEEANGYAHLEHIDQAPEHVKRLQR